MGLQGKLKGHSLQKGLVDRLEGNGQDQVNPGFDVFQDEFGAPFLDEFGANIETPKP